MAGLYQRRIRTAVARRRTRDLLPLPRSEANGCLGWRGSFVRCAEGALPDTRSRRRQHPADKLRSQSRWPAIPGPYANQRPGAHADHRSTELDRIAEEVASRYGSEQRKRGSTQIWANDGEAAQTM